MWISCLGLLCRQNSAIDKFAQAVHYCKSNQSHAGWACPAINVWQHTEEHSLVSIYSLAMFTKGLWAKSKLQLETLQQSTRGSCSTEMPLALQPRRSCINSLFFKMHHSKVSITGKPFDRRGSTHRVKKNPSKFPDAALQIGGPASGSALLTWIHAGAVGRRRSPRGQLQKDGTEGNKTDQLHAGPEGEKEIAQGRDHQQELQSSHGGEKKKRASPAAWKERPAAGGAFPGIRTPTRDVTTPPFLLGPSPEREGFPRIRRPAFVLVTSPTSEGEPFLRDPLT